MSQHCGKNRGGLYIIVQNSSLETSQVEPSTDSHASSANPHLLFKQSKKSLIQTISFIFSQHCIVSPNCVPRKFFLWINLPQTPPLGPPPQVFALQTKYKTCFDDPRTPHTDLYRTYMVTKVMKWYEMCSSNQSNLLPILQ